MPNSYAFKLMSAVLKEAIERGEFPILNVGSCFPFKKVTFNTTNKNKLFEDLKNIDDEIQDSETWITEVKQLFQNNISPETACIYVGAMLRAFLSLIKFNESENKGDLINAWLSRIDLTQNEAVICLDNSANEGFDWLQNLQFLDVTVNKIQQDDDKNKHKFSVSYDALPQVMAVLSNTDTDPSYVKQQIVSYCRQNKPDFLTLLQQTHSEEVSKEKIRVDLACLFLHNILSHRDLGVPIKLIEQLKSNDFKIRNKVLNECREILRQTSGIAQLLALPYVGNDFDKVSRTLAAHFGQICEAELFVQLEADGLKFYCIPTDAEKLIACFKDAGFNVDSQKKEGGPDLKQPSDFKSNNCVLCFPHREVEQVFKIAQYNPGNIRAVVNALYKQENIRLEALTKEAIGNADSLKNPVSQSDIPLNKDINISRHPADSGKILIRVNFTVPTLQPSSNNPQRLILVLDDSGSMGPKRHGQEEGYTRIDCLNEAVRTLIRELKSTAPNTCLTVLTLNGGKLVTNVPVSQLTKEQEKDITTISANGNTPLFEATIAGVDTLRQEGWSVIPSEVQDVATGILVTDGKVNQTADDFLRGLTSGTPVYYSADKLQHQGFGTKEFPNHRPFVLIPIGIGKDYKKELLHSLGQKMGYGFYDVPEPSETTKAVTAASQACLPKTSEIIFGIGTKEKTVTKQFKPLLSGQSVSYCFTADYSQSEQPKQVLFYGETKTIVSSLPLPEKTSLQYDYTVIADYVLQEHDQLMIKKAGELKGMSMPASRGGCSQPSPPTSNVPADLIQDLYKLLNQLGDMPHPLLDYVRKEIYASIDQIRAENADIYARLSLIGRRAGGLESQDPQSNTAEKSNVVQTNAQLIQPWGKNSKAKSKGVRTEINYKLSNYFGCEVVLTADANDFSVSLSFKGKAIAENFSHRTEIKYPTGEMGEQEQYTFNLPPEHVVELFDVIAGHKGESPLVQQRNLLQRFVGIGIEEALGSTKQGWPSGLRFEAGHPWFIDGKGTLRKGVLELQQAFIDAKHQQNGLTGTLATLLGVVIERAALTTKESYQKAIPSVVQLTNPTWNIYHQGYQFDVERVGNVRMSISQAEKQILISWLQTKLHEQGLENVIEPRYFAKGEINKCILKCKQQLTKDQRLAVERILQELMSENELSKWNELMITFRESQTLPQKNQPLSAFPELEDLLTDPISLELFEDPVITPQGQTYSGADIKEWLASHSTDPITKQSLEEKDLRSNQAVSYLLNQFKTKGVDLTENPVKDEWEKIDGIDNRVIQAVSEFFAPPIKDNIPLIDHPNFYTVIAVAAAMLVPGEGCLDIEDARNGLRLPTMTLNYDGSLIFTFDSIEYTHRLYRALNTRGLKVNLFNQNDLIISAESVDDLLSQYLKINSQVLIDKMKAAGISINTNETVDTKATNEKQDNLKERLNVTQIPTLSKGLNKLSAALQGQSAKWKPYESTGVIQCALQNFMALHAEKLPDQEKQALQRVSQLLMDDKAQFTSGLKRDENVVKFASGQCSENEDHVFQKFAEQDADDLLNGAENRRIINKDTDIFVISKDTSAPLDKVNQLLHPADGETDYQLPGLLSQTGKPTDELILTGGGQKEHRAIIKIVKVAFDKPGNPIKLGENLDAANVNYRYFYMEFNAGAGAAPVEGSPHQVWSVITREITQKDKPIEETLKNLIVAQRMLLRYRSVHEIAKNQPYLDSDVEEAEKWLKWFKQAEDCLGGYVPELCQKGPAQTDDSCELTSLKLFLDYHLPPELAKRFWQFATSMNASMTENALRSQIDGKDVSVNIISKTFPQAPSRFTPHAMAPLKLGHTAVAPQGDKSSIPAASINLDEQLQALRDKVAKSSVVSKENHKDVIDSNKEREDKRNEQPRNDTDNELEKALKLDKKFLNDVYDEVFNNSDKKFSKDKDDRLFDDSPEPFLPINKLPQNQQIRVFKKSGKVVNVENEVELKPQPTSNKNFVGGREEKEAIMLKETFTLQEKTLVITELPEPKPLPAQILQPLPVVSHNLPETNETQPKALADLKRKAIFSVWLMIPTTILGGVIGGMIGLAVGGPVGAAIGACVGAAIGAAIPGIPALYYYRRQLNSACIVQPEDGPRGGWPNIPTNTQNNRYIPVSTQRTQTGAPQLPPENQSLVISTRTNSSFPG